MIELRTLGTVDLRDRRDGRRLRSVLSQSKRVALLAYLAVGNGGGYVRRDTLLGLCWPERSEERARHALSQALYVLRRGLGAGAIETNGDEQVRAAPEALWCDAVAFGERLAAGDPEGALELYGGEFLDGLHAPGSPGFERWVQGERERLRSRAVDAASRLAEERTREGNPVEAVRWARRAGSLDPYDEGIHRGLIDLLAGLGDRAGALRTYRTFASRLEDDLGLAPSESLREAVAEIQAGEPGGVAAGERESSSPGPTAAEAPAGERPAPDPVEARPPGSIPASSERGPRFRPPRSFVRIAAALVGAAALGLALAVGLAFLGDGDASRVPAADAGSPPVVAVPPFLNHTDDETLDGLARMAADWVTWGLRETGLAQVSNSVPEREVGALLIRGSVYRQADSLVVAASIVDPASGRVIASPAPVPVARDDPSQGLELLRQRVMGGLAATLDVRMERWSELASKPPSFEAYQLFVRGLELHLSEFEDLQAREHYLRAARIDSTFTLPLLWAMWVTYDAAQKDSLLRVLESRRRRLPLLERHLLDYHVAQDRGDDQSAYRAILRVVELSPESGYLYKAGRAAYRVNRQREALGLLERADPDEGWLRGWPLYWIFLARTRHLLGDYAGALAAAREGWRRGSIDPYRPFLRMREVEALAGLGRFGELDELVRLREVAYDLPGGRVAMLLEAAEEVEAHGHPKVAERYWKWAVEEGLRGSSDDELPPGVRSRLILALARHGAHAEARALLRAEQGSAGDVPHSPLWLGTSGVVAARTGEPEEARARLRALERSAFCDAASNNRPTAADPCCQSLPCARSLFWQAAISAAIGERADALRRLDGAVGAGLGPAAEYHSHAALQPLWGDPDFEEIIGFGG